MPAEDSFPYTGLTGRPPGPVVRALSRVLPGVATVQAQVEPYAAAWRVRNAAALRSSHVRWVALGDSMTQAIGADSPDRGWLDQLAERLPDPPAIVNLSQSGARVEDVLEQQLPAWRALPPAPAGELITVLIGSNDVFGRRYRSLLPEGFAELLRALPDGAVVATIPSPSAVAARVNELIEQADASGRVRAMRTERFPPETWRNRLAADRFHPNELGYALIAYAFEPGVRAALADALRGDGRLRFDADADAGMADRAA